MMVGKDTVGDWLVEQRGFTKLGFADGVREVGTLLFGLSDVELRDPEIKKRVMPIDSIIDLDKAAMKMYEWVWSDLNRRKLVSNDDTVDCTRVYLTLKNGLYSLLNYHNVTIRNWLQVIGTECFRTLNPNFWVKYLEMKIKTSGLERIVITDVRFDNEGEMIKRLNGTIIKIERDLAIHLVNTHASEKEMNVSPDYVIVNDGSMDHLYQQISMISDDLYGFFR